MTMTNEFEADKYVNLDSDNKNQVSKFCVYINLIQ